MHGLRRPGLGSVVRHEDLRLVRDIVGALMGCSATIPLPERATGCGNRYADLRPGFGLLPRLGPKDLEVEHQDQRLLSRRIQECRWKARVHRIRPAVGYMELFLLPRP